MSPGGWLGALRRLFFPDTCPVCGKVKGEGSAFMCADCIYDFPLTGFPGRPDNPVVELFYGQIPIVQGSALFWYVHGSGYRKMIHALKYHGRWGLARSLGEWLGSELEEGGLYGGVDVVIPIPLHGLRRIRRGYNQSEYLAQGIAEKLCRPVDFRSVRRHKYNRSQALRSRKERWANVEGIFSVRHPKRLEGKHILLVDDVLTTGATIVSCAEAILRAAPGCRISVATLAASKSHLQAARRRVKNF